MIDLKAIARQVKGYDGYFMCWSGVYFDTAHRFLRVDKLFLNVVYRDRDRNMGVLRRVTARLNRDEHKEPVLNFSLDPQYKITSGVRRGRMVLASDVKEDESFTYAGLSKNLEMGNGSNQFNPRRRVKDIATLKLLSYFNDPEEVADPTEVMPDIYLTCKERNINLHVRKNGMAVHNLRMTQGYDPHKDIDTNARRLRRAFSEPAGDGRVAYPFDMFYGKGVLAAKIANEDMMLGQWYKVPEFNAEAHHIRFSEHEHKTNTGKIAGRSS